MLKKLIKKSSPTNVEADIFQVYTDEVLKNGVDEKVSLECLYDE